MFFASSDEIVAKTARAQSLSLPSVTSLQELVGSRQRRSHCVGAARFRPQRHRNRDNTADLYCRRFPAVHADALLSPNSNYCSTPMF